MQTSLHKRPRRVKHVEPENTRKALALDAELAALKALESVRRGTYTRISDESGEGNSSIL